jgi:putative membrane protein insertion efficiency factor
MSWLKLSLQALLYPIKVILIDIVYIYKWIISPCLPHTCRFYPTCSTYMLLSIREWGIFRGLWLGTKRIFRCRPGGKCGEDFVPLNIKGELKWIY